MVIYPLGIYAGISRIWLVKHMQEYQEFDSLLIAILRSERILIIHVMIEIKITKTADEKIFSSPRSKIALGKV